MSPADDGSGPGETDAIEVRAFEFLQRQRLAHWTLSDQEELETWLEGATAHRVAYLRCASVEAQIERTIESEPEKFLAMLPLPWRRYLGIGVGLAASLTLTAGATWWAVTGPLATEDRTYSTEVGGQASLSLSDGTRILLSTDTLARVRTTNRERTVWLERGEAFFHVTHDTARPFTVIAGHRHVVDVGTEFLVRSDNDRFEVALLHGRAEYSTDEAKSQVATLTPGDEVIATSGKTLFVKKSPTELSDETSWRSGVLKFRHTPLADAVREFNRYYRTKLVIRDPAVARLPIGGDFQLSSINGFLRAMQMVLHLHLEEKDGTILIDRAPAENQTTVDERSER